ncbi:MAG: hypothetical protein ACU0BF_02665 [Paracoccaceae bacterium]
MFPSLIGSLVIAALVAWGAERWGLTHNGILRSVVIALGGVLLVWLVRIMFGLSLGSPGLDAIAGAISTLLLIPTEAAHRRRNRR